MAILISIAAPPLPALADFESMDAASSDLDSATTLPGAGGTTSVTEQKASLANRNAMLLPASIHLHSTVGTPAYYQEAYEYQCRAAKEGDSNGYYVMGWLYANGRGVTKDFIMASTLLKMAAENGHIRAKEILEVMPQTEETPPLPACLTVQHVTNQAMAPLTPPEMPATEEPVEFYKRNGKIHQLVSRLAPKYGIDIDLAMAVIAVESGFNPRITSAKNAQGLMQLIPDTSRRFQVRDAYDPEDNVKGGLAYLSWLMFMFKGDVNLVVAAYNAGEKTVEKYGGIPPFPETQSYVQKIRALYHKSSHPFRERTRNIQ